MWETGTGGTQFSPLRVCEAAVSGNDNKHATFGRQVRLGCEVLSAEQYRSYAAECLRLAQQATNAEDRARLLGMAQAWRELADKLERENDGRG